MGVLAGALAHAVGFDEKKVNEMVLVGLLHDIGQVRSGRPPKRQNSSSKRFIAWQASVAKHWEEMLREVNIFSDGVIRGLASQFEIYYGGGTPSGVSGKDIPAEARLLHIVRTYCRYLGEGRLRLCPHTALSIMFFDSRDFFDDEYLTCFLKLLGVYPVGTYVTISGEKIGVVVGYSEDLQHISIVTHEEGVPSSAVMPSLLGDISSKIIEDIPPYLLPKEKTKYFSFT